MEIESLRSVLETIFPDLARRIVVGELPDDDNRHPEYSLENEVVPLVRLPATSSPDPVFTKHLIRRKSGAYAIGGFGFFGQPESKVLVQRVSAELLTWKLSSGHCAPQRKPTFAIAPRGECSKGWLDRNILQSRHHLLQPPAPLKDCPVAGRPPRLVL